MSAAAAAPNSSTIGGAGTGEGLPLLLLLCPPFDDQPWFEPQPWREPQPFDDEP